MTFPKDKRLLAIYQQLHDELSQLIETPETSEKLRAAIGDNAYHHLVELLITAADIN